MIVALKCQDRWPSPDYIIQSEVVNPTPLVPRLFLVGLETVGLASGLCKTDRFLTIYGRITAYTD